MRDFDKQFEKHRNQMDSTMKVFGWAWLIWALVCLSSFVGIVYVLMHFISKFW